MMCKKPFYFNPTGSTVKERLYSRADYDSRLAATPFGCGTCLHCRINRSRVWQHRIMLETRLHQESSFITLTYKDETLPEDQSLEPEDLQLFMKRIRYYANKNRERNIRFFGVGEYGSTSFRAHYHVCLFGVSPFEESMVEKAWSFRGEPYGHRHNGELNEKSAAYITGYVIKDAMQCDPARLGRTPEFMRCSTGGKNPKTKGGIGAGQARLYAQKLRNNKSFKEKFVETVKHGRKERPLGRYLVKVIADELGATEEDYIQRLYDYQNELFEKHLDQPVYSDSVLAEKEVHRLQQEKRHKIFQSKRRI